MSNTTRSRSAKRSRPRRSSTILNRDFQLKLKVEGSFTDHAAAGSDAYEVHVGEGSEEIFQLSGALVPGGDHGLDSDSTPKTTAESGNPKRAVLVWLR
ncbi:MAG: hypothetical protein R3F11_18105 [Verrucomicrobiales bacterium]